MRGRTAASHAFSAEAGKGKASSSSDANGKRKGKERSNPCYRLAVIGMILFLVSIPLLVWIEYETCANIGVSLWKFEHCVPHAIRSVPSCVNEDAVEIVATLPEEKSEIPQGCVAGCDLPFGTVQGSHNGVVAYSNCNHETCISYHENYVSEAIIFSNVEVSVADVAEAVSHGKIGSHWEAYEELQRQHSSAPFVLTGMKWQCVEYARRYLSHRGLPRASFGGVDGAADIWELGEVHVLEPSRPNTNRGDQEEESPPPRTLPLFRYPNGQPLHDGGSIPKAGDMIIYARGDQAPYGHVAVIVAVEINVVYIAEQNWHADAWPAPFRNHSRALPLRFSESQNAYFIDDTAVPLLGWMRY